MKKSVALKKSLAVKTKQKASVNNLFLFFTILVLVSAISGLKMYGISTQPDSQCFISHTPVSVPPQNLKTAKDFLLQGDYEYEKGSCDKAVQNYTKAININPKYAEAYNNRGYTYMRIRNFENAIYDLNKAIELRPNYINALTNRGDIYNYYHKVDRAKALADYNTALASGAAKTGSLCGHRLLAINNGWNLKAFWTILTKGVDSGCN